MKIPTSIKIFFSSFRNRLIISVASILAVLMSVFIIDSILRQHQMILNNQIQEGTALAQAIAVTASGWLATNDVEGLQELVDAQNKYPYLLFAILTDKNGHIKAHNDKSKIGQYLLDLPTNPNQTITSKESQLIDIAAPSLLFGKHVGWVRIGISQKRASEQLKSITYNGIIYGILAIMLGAFIVWLLGSYLTRRLYAVQNTINQVAMGNYKARSLITGNDEAAIIALEFNNLLDAQQKSDLEIQKNRKSLEDYKFALDQSAAITITDKEGVILSVNDNFCIISKYNREELIGKTLQINNSDFHPSSFFKKMWAEINSGKVWSGEIKEKKKDGEFYWVHTTVIPFLDIDKKPFQYLSVRFNISEKKKSEEKLIQSEEKYRTLTENITDAIILTDKDNNAIYRSPATEKITGYSNKESNGFKLLDIIYEEDHAQCAIDMQRLLNTANGINHFKVRIKHKLGHLVWIEGTASNMLHNESISGIVTNFRDITERKLAEEQLALSALIVNSTDDAIMSNTIDGIITSWNPGAEKVLGYSAYEAIGKSIYMIISPDLHLEEKMISENLKKGKPVDHYETLRIRKDGKIINVSLTISPIIDESGYVIGVSKIMRDISDQKIMELERIKIISELVQRNRDLEQFSYIISHNLRAPVANIIGISDLMLSSELNLQEKEQMNLGLSKSVNALDVVIKDLNHILQTKREISEQTTVVTFPNLLDEIKLSIANLIKNEHVNFVVDFTAISEMVSIKSYLYSVFYNLITNSIKYKQPMLNPVIEIRSKLTEHGIELVFKDNGLGIDLEKKGEQVFGLYKRFHSHAEGKGMGLYMVKTQIETLGGKISVRSEVNKYTEFIIEFENLKR